MIKDIVTQDLHEMQKQDDHKVGVLGEYANIKAARVHFAQVMRARGYVLGNNQTWLKPGFAAVMMP